MPRPALVLDGINLVLPARGATGIVGASGIGQDHTHGHLAGLLVPSAGELLADDIAIDATRLAGWRRRIAYVTQEEFLFDDSVRANLTVASPGTADAQIWDALAAARADRLVRELPRASTHSSGTAARGFRGDRDSASASPAPCSASPTF